LSFEEGLHDRLGNDVTGTTVSISGFPRGFVVGHVAQFSCGKLAVNLIHFIKQFARLRIVDPKVYITRNWYSIRAVFFVGVVKAKDDWAVWPGFNFFRKKRCAI
jgi:hypothetical protein